MKKLMNEAFYEEVTSLLNGCHNRMGDFIDYARWCDTLHELAEGAQNQVEQLDELGDRSHLLDILTVFLKHKAPSKGLTQWGEAFWKYCRDKYGGAYFPGYRWRPYC